ncbi:MAG: hypothetical protein AMXMBFR33_68630 [Candidatus Xenobia bacterium]
MSKEFGLPQATLTPGNVGEFTVWIDGQKLAEKGPEGFPSERELREAMASRQSPAQ